MAGVVYTLMGDRAYRKKVIRLDDARQERQQSAVNEGAVGYGHPAIVNLGLKAPLPPTDATSWSPPKRR
jgi:hypothetical protein